jgi:hypothetical protein
MTTEDLRKELQKREIEERKIKNKEQEEYILSELNKLVNKCYMKSCSRNKKMAYRFLGIKHKLTSQYGNKLLEVVLTLDKVIALELPEKSFNRHSVIYNHFQSNPYSEMTEQRFVLEYDKENGMFDFSKSFCNFTMYLQEISSEVYEEMLEICNLNEQMSKNLIEKFKIK